MTGGWRVEITPPGRRDLRRLDPPVRQRIFDALDRLVADPPAGDVIKLRGRDEPDAWRAGRFSDAVWLAGSSWLDSVGGQEREA